MFRSTTSEVFELLAQHGELRFLVHKDVLTSKSQPFRDAATGKWKEATERKIDLGDWDGDTVGRLVEFLYTGDYRYPNPEPRSPKPGLQESPSNREEPDSQGIAASKVSGEESSLDRNRPLTPLSECLRNSLTPDPDNPKTDATRLENFDPDT